MVSFAVHHHHPRSATRRRPWWFVALAVVVVTLAGTVLAVVGGGALYAGSVASTFESHVSHIQQAFPPDATRPAATRTGAVNILLLGSDSRGAATDIGSTDVSDQRADTMMLLHIDADRRDVYLMSIMRDLWVPIPGHGTAKINAALAWGGTPLVIRTVEQLLGARIDHVAIVDFAGLKDMTNALGGVDVDSPVGFTTVKSPHYTFVKGMNHLDGDQALAFARERYAFPTADYQRVADQQALMRAFGAKLLSFSVLSDPGRLTSFAATAGSYVKVDRGLTVQAMLGLAAGMRLSGMSSIHTFTLPTAGTGTAEGQSIVLVDQSALVRLRTALADDALSAFAG